MIFDCHVHTEFSACAEDVSLAWYARKAREEPLAFALTDHSAQVFFPPDQRWGFWGDGAVELFERCAREGAERCYHYVRAVSAHRSDNLLCGVELDIMPDGRAVFAEELLPSLDIVLGAVHVLQAVSERAPQAEVEAEFRFQVDRFGELGADVLAHPFRLILSQGYEAGPRLVEWLVEAATRHGMALEVNSHKRFPEQDLLMARLALEAGATLALGTDTHRASELGDHSYHEMVAAEVGADLGVYLARPEPRPQGESGAALAPRARIPQDSS